ncbi:MAG: ubiquinol-cytochrome c reductase iron-sulfur subunit [Phycisphaerae bacterium]
MRESEPSRRRFLARVVVALNALVAMVVATPAGGYLLSPLLRRRSSQWVVIGRASKFRVGIPQRISYAFDDEGGYSVERTRRVAFVQRSEDALIVLSPICTHMGCNVAFHEASSLFECPCHGGKYDLSGRVVEGPPPEPLRRFQTRVRDGNLEIRVT